MSLLRLAYIFLFVAPLCLFGAKTEILKEPSALKYAFEKLPRYGTLKKTREDFLYVEIPDEAIDDLIQSMPDTNLIAPPYFGPGGVGAHITVATQEEMLRINVKNIPFLGQKVFFTPKNIERVSVSKNLMGREIYFVTVESRQICEIRTLMGLPPKIEDHDFHITFGVVKDPS